MFLSLDPIYYLFVGPALLLSLYASVKVKSSFRKFSKVGTRSGLTGAQAAQRILQEGGITDVSIEASRGFLSDHYDPGNKTLRLSPDVYSGRSIASMGVAAHEAGHAFQHSSGYVPLKLRSMIVPVASIGTNLAWPLLIFGFILSLSPLVKIGIIFFGAAVAFQIITLPVEFNASRRALAALSSSAILTTEEVSGAKKVLSAAALTYIAAALTALLQLIYFIMRASR
jgi:Zn-dependent membrane protease YugP